MQNREVYFQAVGELLTEGKTEAEAHSAVRTKYPQVFNRLAQEAVARRGRPGHRRQRETTQASAPTPPPPPTFRDLVNLAIAGESVDQVDVVNACRSINRHPNAFSGEVRRERDRIEAMAAEKLKQASEPTASQRRQPQRKPANQPATNYFGADYIDPNEHRFNLAVAEAAKCERTYSDNEIVAAGFDVTNFRSALRDAVHAKVTKRAYSVGSVVCDCSGPGGVCVCR